MCPSSVSRPTDKKTKKVTFARTASVRLSMHSKDYTDEERQAVYYTRKDFQEMKEEVKNTVLMLELQKPIDEVHFSRRGVDSRFTPSALQLRTKRTRAALFAVMTEQMNQFQEQELNGCAQQQKPQHEQAEEKHGATSNSADRIALVYSKVVHDSVESSYRLGLVDELFVKSEVRGFKVVNGKVQEHSSGYSIFHGNGLLMKMRKRATGSSANRRKVLINSAA